LTYVPMKIRALAPKPVPVMVSVVLASAEPSAVSDAGELVEIVCVGVPLISGSVGKAVA
jgi:hypothetical protein